MHAHQKRCIDFFILHDLSLMCVLFWDTTIRFFTTQLKGFDDSTHRQEVTVNCYPRINFSLPVNKYN